MVDHLTHEERIPFRRLLGQPQEMAGRLSDAEPAEQFVHRVLPQASEVERFRTRCVPEPVSHAIQRVAGRDRSMRTDHHHARRLPCRGRGERQSEVLEEIERGAIDPLQIVQDEEDGARHREPRQAPDERDDDTVAIRLVLLPYRCDGSGEMEKAS